MKLETEEIVGNQSDSLERRLKTVDVLILSQETFIGDDV